MLCFVQLVIDHCELWCLDGPGIVARFNLPFRFIFINKTQ